MHTTRMKSGPIGNPTLKAHPGPFNLMMNARLI